MEEKIVSEKLSSVPHAPVEQASKSADEQLRTPERPVSGDTVPIAEGAATTERVEATSPSSAATAPATPASPERIAVEHILEEGLKDIYVHLPDDKKVAFKDRGEETAAEITTLLQKTKLHIVKIVKLIWKWLSMIPGVDASYLEQESKNKADKIVEMHQKK